MEFALGSSYGKYLDTVQQASPKSAKRPFTLIDAITALAVLRGCERSAHELAHATLPHLAR